MLKHPHWIYIIFFPLFFLFETGCQFPSELKPTFSSSNEILVFDSEKNLLRRFPGLPNVPSDMEFLPNGRLIAAIEGTGLWVIDPVQGPMGSPFGPVHCEDVDVFVGKKFQNVEPYFLTVGNQDETALFLDERGIQIASLAIPKGVRSIQSLENGNFVLAHSFQNKILEINSAGQIVWESTTPLHHPYDIYPTSRNTFLVSDFDSHRIIEIDRQNQILNDIRGCNHPRRLQPLPDGNVLIVDSDLRRIAVIAPPNLLVPLVPDLNRPHSLAYDPASRQLLVGVEPFFQPTSIDLVKNPTPIRIRSFLYGIGGSISILALFLIWKGLTGSFRSIVDSFLAQYRCWTTRFTQPLLAMGIAFCVLGSGFLAVRLFFWGIGLAGIGILLAGISRSLDSALDRERNDESDEQDEEPIDRFWETGLIQRPVLLVLGLILFWWTFLITQLRPFSYWIILPWFIIPWLCAWSFRKRSHERTEPSDPFWWILIFSVAIFFRLYRIYEIPYGLWLDETFSLWDALRESANQSLSPFRTTPLTANGHFDIPNLYLVLLAGVSKTIGASFLMLKSFSIVPSLGIVWGIYCLGKWAWGNWAGRCGALLLAMNSWQVIFARWGWLQQWYVFFAVFALAFYVRAYRWKCPRSAAYGGLFLGLGFYTYVPILLTFVTIIFLFFLSFLEQERRQHGKLMFIYGIHLVLVFAPLWNYYLSSPGIFLSRANTVGMKQEIIQNGSLDPLKQNIAKYSAMLHVQGDFNPRHNFPNAPLLDPLTGGLFLVGLSWILKRFYRPAERILCLALIFALLGGILSVSKEAPNSFRTGVFGPVVCLIAVLPLASLLETRWRILEESFHSQRWVIGFTILTFFSIGSWNYYRLFVQFPSEQTWIATFGQIQHRIFMELTPDNLGVDRLYIHPQFNNLTMNLYTYFLEVEKEGPLKASLDHNRYTILDIEKQVPNVKTGTTLFFMPCEDELILKEKFPEIDISVLSNPHKTPIAIQGKIFKDPTQ